MCKKDGKEMWLKIVDDEYEEYNTKKELLADLNSSGLHLTDEQLDEIRILHVIIKQEYHPILPKAPIELELTT